MAKSVRVKWHLKNWSELRNSPGVMADLDQRASKIAHAAGPGFTRRRARKGDLAKSRKNPRRANARASVGTNTYESRRRQAEDNVLQRALNAGRG